MIQEISRPLSDAERRLLRRRLALPEPGRVFWMRDERRLALFTVSVCAAIFMAGVMMSVAILGGIVAGVFALMRLNGYWMRRRLRLHMLAYRQRLAEDFKSGLARVITCRPVRVIEREAFEDEGNLWIFDGGDGCYLAVCGQEYYETPRFPSSHFDVVMGGRHGSVLGIRSHGLRVPATLLVKDGEIPWESFPDREIVVFAAPPNAELAVVLQGLRGAGAGQPWGGHS